MEFGKKKRGSKRGAKKSWVSSMFRRSSSKASKRRGSRRVKKRGSRRGSKKKSWLRSLFSKKSKIVRSKKYGPYVIKSNKIYLMKKSSKGKSYSLHKNKKGVYFNKNKKKHYITKAKHGFGSMPSLNQIMGNYEPATMSLYEQNTGMPPNQFNSHMSQVDPSLVSNFYTDVI